MVILSVRTAVLEFWSLLSVIRGKKTEKQKLKPLYRRTRTKDLKRNTKSKYFEVSMLLTRHFPIKTEIKNTSRFPIAWTIYMRFRNICDIYMRNRKACVICMKFRILCAIYMRFWIVMPFKWASYCMCHLPEIS